MEIDFILVEPGVPENIGASARAIKNMGFRSLKMVNPCNYMDGKARWLAHGSTDILENARVYSSLAEATDGSDLVIGTTARFRITRSEYIPADRLVSLLKDKGVSEGTISIVFGREESGLTNQEMDLCDITSIIPMKQTYPSLNLSQAVMVYAWELSRMDQVPLQEQDNQGKPESLKTLKKNIERLFSLVDMRSGSALKGRVMERVSLASGNDLNLIHSVTNAVINKISTLTGEQL